MAAENQGQQRLVGALRRLDYLVGDIAHLVMSTSVTSVSTLAADAVSGKTAHHSQGDTSMSCTVLPLLMQLISGPRRLMLCMHVLETGITYLEPEMSCLQTEHSK